MTGMTITHEPSTAQHQAMLERLDVAVPAHTKVESIEVQSLDIAWTYDERSYIASRTATITIRVPVDAETERGLLAIAQGPRAAS